MTVTLEEGRALVKDHFDALCPPNKWFRDQDVIPRGETLVLIFIHPKEDLTPEWIGSKLYDAGFTSHIFERDPDAPNVYRAAIYRFTAAEITPSGLMRNYLGAYYVTVLREPIVGDFLPLDFIREGRELMDSLKDREPTILNINEPLPLGEWIYLLHHFSGQPRPSPEVLAERLRGLGYKAFVFSEGIGSMMFSSRDAYLGENTVGIMFNPGEVAVTSVGIAQEAYADMIDPSGGHSVGVVGVTFPALQEKQTSIDGAYTYIMQTQKLGINLKDTGESMVGVVDSLTETLGLAAKAGKYVVWGALGLGITYVAWRLYLGIGQERGRYKKLKQSRS